MRKLLLLSNSVLHGSGYLEYAKDYVIEFFAKNGVKEILFVPYANPFSQEKYTEKVRSELNKWGYVVKGLNEADDPKSAINQAQCIFIGGGNTFLLLKHLQEKQLIDTIRNRVLKDGIPYLGSSAGTNVATISISTTNDMPIVHCPSLEALSLVPFNINPHYLDSDPTSRHMGETRETRISEYHALPGTPPVLGLREGSFLHVRGEVATLGGLSAARLFRRGKPAEEHVVGSDLSFLFKSVDSV
jgi:dipeptidase E